MNGEVPELERIEEADEAASADLRELVRFALASARRHWGAGTLVFCGVVALGISAAVLLPKRYETRTVILVGEEGFMTQVNPARRAPLINEFRAVTQRVLRQDNLRAIVQETNLAELWSRHRPPLLRFKDWVLGNAIDRLDERTRERILMGTLAQRLFVETDHATTITIGARWSDPHTVTRIVEVARRRFFDERLQNEVEVYEEVLSLQEDHAKGAAREVERLLQQVEKVSWYEPPVDPAALRTQTAETLRPGPAVQRLEPDPLLVVKLEKVRQRIRETREPWQRRLMELRLQLTDLRATYAEKHPLVIHQQARIREDSKPPEELEALQADEKELLARIEAYSRAPAVAARRGPIVRTSESSSKSEPIRLEHSATLSAEQAKLIQAINRYNELSERVASTRLEIAALETAFKHRYTIAAEEEMPEGPVKPRLPLFIVLGSVLGGLLLGVGLGPLLELSRGRILAAWQLENLGMPVLGEVPLRSNALSKRGER